jgi:hypothetical protein
MRLEASHLASSIHGFHSIFSYAQTVDLSCPMDREAYSDWLLACIAIGCQELIDCSCICRQPHFPNLSGEVLAIIFRGLQAKPA